MRIGELAKSAGIPTSTIRFYEAKGLLPEPERKANGYRIYSEQTLQRLSLIRFSQQIGRASCRERV